MKTNFRKTICLSLDFQTITDARTLADIRRTNVSRIFEEAFLFYLEAKSKEKEKPKSSLDFPSATKYIMENDSEFEDEL